MFGKETGWFKRGDSQGASSLLLSELAIIEDTKEYMSFLGFTQDTCKLSWN